MYDGYKGILKACQMYDENNIFAKILRHEISCRKILENEHTLAFHDVNPQRKIHLLVIPKGKYCDFSHFHQTASLDEIQSFWHSVNETVQQTKLDQKGYRLIANQGAHGAQEVCHFHVHLLGGGARWFFGHKKNFLAWGCLAPRIRRLV